MCVCAVDTNTMKAQLKLILMLEARKPNTCTTTTSSQIIHSTKKKDRKNNDKNSPPDSNCNVGALSSFWRKCSWCHFQMCQSHGRWTRRVIFYGHNSLLLFCFLFIVRFLFNLNFEWFTKPTKEPKTTNNLNSNLIHQTQNDCIDSRTARDFITREKYLLNFVCVFFFLRKQTEKSRFSHRRRCRHRDSLVYLCVSKLILKEQQHSHSLVLLLLFCASSFGYATDSFVRSLNQTKTQIHNTLTTNGFRSHVSAYVCVFVLLLVFVYMRRPNSESNAGNRVQATANRARFLSLTLAPSLCACVKMDERAGFSTVFLFHVAFVCSHKWFSVRGTSNM